MLNVPEADAIVVGSGPNGLSAAILLAQAGCKITVVEAAQQISRGTSLITLFPAVPRPSTAGSAPANRPSGIRSSATWRD
ncbi:MAG TPA: FAD-dependent oxidoreductase [Terriglobales bacterium]